VTTLGDLFAAQDSSLQVFTFKVGGNIAGNRSVRSKIAGLGAEANFFASESTPRQLGEGHANRAFRALEPVIDCRIDDVDTAFHGCDKSVNVNLIG
jgi:hypothetical protein